jgi:3-hydroxybutyryl-CoA dehydrogenase
MTSYRSFDPTAPIAIIGTGVMGSKVAWACARAGIPIRAYDVSRDILHHSLEQALTWSDGEELEILRANLHACEELGDALNGVQLAFENVPEKLDLKQKVLADIGQRLAPESYMGSNTSALRCSPLAHASGRPDRFFNLNWSDPRFMQLVELMGCAQTAPEANEFAKEWMRHVRMVPIHVKKEQMGYSFNRVWRVIKKEVLRQIAEGVIDPHDIDRAWMLAFGTSFGPCGLMDMVSMPSVKNIELAYYYDTDDPSDRPPAFLDDMIEEGKCGQKTAEGFYTYPNPAYEDPEWLGKA